MTKKLTMAFYQTKRLVTVFSLVLMGAALNSTDANAQWRVTPSVGVGFHYDDNVRLNSRVSGVDDSEDGYAVELSAEAAYQTELTQLFLTPKVSFERYSSSSSLDTTDQFLKFDLRRRGEKSRFRFLADYREETIRRAERLETDFDIDELVEIPSDSSGVVLSDRDRQLIRLMPEFSHRFTQRVLAGLRLNYVDVSYDSGSGSDFNDYNENQAEAFFEYALSPRNSILLSVLGHKYELDAASGDTTGVGIGAGFHRSLSERTSFRVNLGIDSTEDDVGNDQENVIGDISVSHKLQTTTIFAAYRRNVSGSGFGDVSVRDTVLVNFRRSLSERSTIGLAASAYQLSALDSNNQAFVERDYLQLRASYSWRFSRNFLVEFNYRFTEIDRNDVAGSEDSNRINIWFRYRPIRE